jgi:CheY-like chemotaxis protein
MSKRILLADDSAAVRKSIEKTLDSAEYELTVSEDGHGAMEQVTALRPHLVLAHAMLPEIDGYEICRQVKENPDSSHIPVLLLTGTFEPFDINRAKEVGYDGFVTKPLDARELKGLMKQVIDRAVYPAEEPAQVEEPEPEPLPDPENEPAPEPVEEPPAQEVTDFPTPEPAPEPESPSVSEAMLDRIFPEEPESEPVAAEAEAEELFTVVDQPEDPVAEDNAETAPTAEFGAWGEAETTEETGDQGTETLTAAPAVEEKTGDDSVFPTEDSDLSWFLRKFEEKAPDQEPEQPEVVEDDPFAPVTDDVVETLSVDEPALVEEPVQTEAPIEIDEPAPDAEAAVDGEPVIFAEPAEETGPETGDADAEEAPAAATTELTDDQLDRIARRVVDLLSEKVLRDVAWEAVPEIAERLIRERIREIEAEADTSA